MLLCYANFILVILLPITPILPLKRFEILGHSRQAELSGTPGAGKGGENCALYGVAYLPIFFDIVHCFGCDNRQELQARRSTSRPFRGQTGANFEPFGGIGGF